MFGAFSAVRTISALCPPDDAASSPGCLHAVLGFCLLSGHVTSLRSEPLESVGETCWCVCSSERSVVVSRITLSLRSEHRGGCCRASSGKLDSSC